jgi:hypothetical protein
MSADRILWPSDSAITGDSQRCGADVAAPLVEGDAYLQPLVTHYNKRSVILNPNHKPHPLPKFYRAR